MLDNLSADAARYIDAQARPGRIGVARTLWIVFLHPELWMIASYRYGRWINRCVSPILFRRILRIPLYVLHPALEMLLGVHISGDADIGKGFYLGHYGCVWIGPSRMGEGCNVAQEVTIGIGGRGEFRGVPEIGNRVWIGAGAKIFGKIRIGDDVAIGANAVVSKSLPDKAVVVGNPGRIVGYAGSAGIVD